MKVYVFAFSVLMIIFSCKKEEKTMSKTALLTDRPWKFVKIESKTNNWPWMDEVPFWPDCKKDDEIVFKSDHSYLLRQGMIKCDPMASDIMDIATWKFMENESRFDMDGAVTSIEKLDDRQFILFASTTSGSDIFYSRFTLEH